MTGRGQANALTRATAILAALFFATSLGLTISGPVYPGSGSDLPKLHAHRAGQGPGQRGRWQRKLARPIAEDGRSGIPKPALPPDMTLPGQNGPGAPQPGQSVMETRPAAPAGPDLPLPVAPAAPLVPAAPSPLRPRRRSRASLAEIISVPVLEYVPKKLRDYPTALLGTIDNGRNNLRVYV